MTPLQTGCGKILGVQVVHFKFFLIEGTDVKNVSYKKKCARNGCKVPLLGLPEASVFKCVDKMVEPEGEGSSSSSSTSSASGESEAD